MNVITKEMSIEAAYARTSERPELERESEDSRWFERQVKAYFPEFDGFERVGVTMPLGPKVREKWFGGSARNFCENIVDYRPVIYKYEYRNTSGSTVADLWDVLSFGAPLPEDGEAAREAILDLGAIWGSCRHGISHRLYLDQLTKIKTGELDLCELDAIADRFREEGADLMVDAYMSGVPVEHLVDAFDENLFFDRRSLRM